MWLCALFLDRRGVRCATPTFEGGKAIVDITESADLQSARGGFACPHARDLISSFPPLAAIPIPSDAICADGGLRWLSFWRVPFMTMVALVSLGLCSCVSVRTGGGPGLTIGPRVYLPGSPEVPGTPLWTQSRMDCSQTALSGGEPAKASLGAPVNLLDSAPHRR